MLLIELYDEKIYVDNYNELNEQSKKNIKRILDEVGVEYSVKNYLTIDSANRVGDILKGLNTWYKLFIK